MGAAGYSFASASIVGKWAVERFTKTLHKVTDWEIENVEDDSFYRSLDVDLLAKTPEGVTLMIEVKGDRYTSGNIYIETVSNRQKGTPGCLTYTGADYVAYYFVRQGYALLIPVPALKEWIGRRVRDFPVHHPSSRAGNSTWDSEGHTVPVRTLIQEVPDIETFYFLDEMKG